MKLILRRIIGNLLGDDTMRTQRVESLSEAGPVAHLAHGPENDGRAGPRSNRNVERHPTCGSALRRVAAI